MFPALSDQTLALSEKVAHATMGIDALYRQETGAESDREGLVVVQMAEVSPTPFASYSEAQECLAGLAQEALALPWPVDPVHLHPHLQRIPHLAHALRQRRLLIHPGLHQGLLLILDMGSQLLRHQGAGFFAADLGDEGR